MSPRDVIIIGSGPAGYTAAIYAARAQLAPLLFEGSVTAGGALMNTTEVENFPGFTDGVMGPQLMEQMRAQAVRFGAEIVTDDITSVDLTGDVKRVVDGNGTTHEARAVILAMGSAYRELGLENEKRLSGHGVSWCATCDGFFFRDQDIAVVGGGDSAVEEATFLTRFARSVTLVHRRDALRASKIMVDRAQADLKLSFAWNAVVEDVLGDAKVSGLVLKDTGSGVARELPVTGLFVAIGHDPRSELVRGQVDLDDEGYVLVQDRSTATNLPGVFACGDLVDHTYRQAITAAGSGCAAALDAEKYLAGAAGYISSEGSDTITIRTAQHEDDLFVTRLLTSSNLPLAGLKKATHILIAEKDGHPVGLIALERHGRGSQFAYLLRSAAVDPTARGRGVGTALVDRALDLVEQDVPVALLTETASAYFPRFGFREVARHDLPTALSASAELQGACPDTAVTMLRSPLQAKR